MGKLMLDDVGKKVRLTTLIGTTEVLVVMAIRAPRGKCFLFKTIHHQGAQLKAVRAFMKQHSEVNIRYV